jgi:hypothetical protein
MMAEVAEFCSSCGLWVNPHEGGLAMHECDNDRVAAYQTFNLDKTFKQFLESEEGKFAVFCAQRLIK